MGQTKYYQFCVIVFLFCTFVSVIQSSQIQVENMAQNREKDNKSQQIVEVETIGYLKNVLKLDLIINFLYCNKTIGLSQLSYHMDNMIYELKNKNKVNKSFNYEFSCHKTSLIQKQNKNGCMLCHKQFKNQTYLAIHYSIHHLCQIFSHQKCKNQSKNQQKDLEKYSIIQAILSQKLYEILSPDDLRIFFSSFAPQDQILEFCNKKFERIFEYYSSQNFNGTLNYTKDRYGAFLKQKDIRQLCMIIALRMGEESIGVNVFRFITVFFLIIFGISYLIYLIFFKLKKADQKHQKHKYKRY